LRLSKGKNDWVSGLFASHPPSQERIDANKKTANELNAEKTLFEGRDEYREAIQWLVSKKDAYTYYDKGIKALKKKAYHKAEDLADKAIASFNGEALFYHLKGQSLLAQKQPKQALPYFSEAITLNPDYFDFYLKRALCKKSLGDLTGARIDAKKSVELLPTGEAHEILGRLALMRGDKRLALHHLQIASHADSPAGARARALLKSN
jgi:tetratricopeptide (TPR) repeat protein